MKKALHARTCVFPKVAINTAWSNKQTERPSAWMKVSAVATKSQGYVRLLVAASKARAKRCVLATHWNVLHAALELNSLTHSPKLTPASPRHDRVNHRRCSSSSVRAAVGTLRPWLELCVDHLTSRCPAPLAHTSLPGVSDHMTAAVK
jgi:hypothetical protein